MLHARPPWLALVPTALLALPLACNRGGDEATGDGADADDGGADALDVPGDTDADREADGDADDAPDDEAGADGDGDGDEAASDGPDACVPDCAGRECGSDGCGGLCPPGCSDGETCDEALGACGPGRGWVETPRDAPPRDFPVMAYDSAREVVVVLISGGISAETWEYDGTAWTEVLTPDAPPSRWYHAMAYDARRRVMVLFGGIGGSDPWGLPYFLADTWEYDGATWTLVETPTSPPPREQPAMVFDARRGVTVLFGGFGGSGWITSRDDTWEYDGTDWTEVETATTPSPRTDCAMAYDETREVVVLYGGVGDSGPPALGDTWEYDGTTWTEAAASGSPPAERAHALAYDSRRGVVVLHGQALESGGDAAQTWEYDGATWTRVDTPASPPRRRNPAAAYDAARGVVVLLGGGILREGYWPDIPLGDLWEYDGANWTEVAMPASPGARQGHAMAFDEARGVTVLFGGSDVWPEPPRADTWEYDGAAWTEVVTPEAPSGRERSALAYDAAREVVVLFGGRDLEGCRDDTWEYDGANWARVATPVAPPARWRHGMAYDAGRGVAVLFGGETEASFSTLDDTWEYDGANWTEIDVRVSPSDRAQHAMAYDAARGIVVLSGGFEIGADTWEYDGTTWREVAPPGATRYRWAHAMVYDSRREVVVLFGGQTGDAGPLVDDTWEYDGAGWTEVATPVSPPPSAGHGMVYDSRRGTSVLFGGGASRVWKYYGP